MLLRTEIEEEQEDRATKRRTVRISAIRGRVLAIVVLGYQWGNSDGRAGRRLQLIETAVAAEGSLKISPVEARERAFHSPNSEDLAPDEKRLIACGTGMPTAGLSRRRLTGCWNWATVTSFSST